MSISAFQEKFLNKGCGTALILFFAVIFLAFGSQCNTNRNAQLAAERGQSVAIATLGNTPISLAAVDGAAEQQMSMYMQQMASMGTPPGPLPAEQQAQILAGALSQGVSGAAVIELARAGGAQIDEKSVRQMFEKMLPDLKDMLIKQGKLKANSTQKEFDTAFLAVSGGKSFEDVVKSRIAELNDPKTHEQSLAQLSATFLSDQIKSKIQISDAEIKADYDTYVLKVILVAGTKPGSKESVEARAAKVEADLKAGKSFESLMDSSSDQPIFDKKKKRSEQTQDIPNAVFTTNADYKTLQGQKVGFVSGQVKSGPDIYFYKLDSIKSSLPKDFEKVKDQKRKEILAQRAQTEMLKKISDFTATAKIDWQIKGYEPLYLVSQARNPERAKDKDALLQKAYDLAKGLASKGDAADLRPATFGLLLASQAIYGGAPLDQRAKLEDQRIEALSLVVKTIDDFSLRMELVDLYAKKKDATNAISSLVAAAKANNSYDPNGQRRFYDITSKGQNLVQQKLITMDQLKPVDEEQTKWRNAKLEADKAAAAAKLQEEKTRKENEAAIQKQKEEAAKNAPKTGTTPGAVAPGAPGKTPDGKTGSAGKFTGGQ